VPDVELRLVLTPAQTEAVTRALRDVEEEARRSSTRTGDAAEKSVRGVGDAWRKVGTEASDAARTAQNTWISSLDAIGNRLERMGQMGAQLRMGAQAVMADVTTVGLENVRWELQLETLLARREGEGVGKRATQWAREYAIGKPVQAAEVVQAMTSMAVVPGITLKQIKEWMPYLATIGAFAGPQAGGTGGAGEAVVKAITGGGTELLRERRMPASMLTRYGAIPKAEGVAAGTPEEQAALGNAIKAFVDANWGGYLEKFGETAEASFSDLEDALRELKSVEAEALVPVLKELVDIAKPLVGQAGAYLKEHPGVAVALAEGGIGAVGAGAVLQGAGAIGTALTTYAALQYFGGAAGAGGGAVAGAGVGAAGGAAAGMLGAVNAVGAAIVPVALVGITAGVAKILTDALGAEALAGFPEGERAGMRAQWGETERQLGGRWAMAGGAMGGPGGYSLYPGGTWGEASVRAAGALRAAKEEGVAQAAAEAALAARMGETSAYAEAQAYGLSPADAKAAAAEAADEVARRKLVGGAQKGAAATQLKQAQDWAKAQTEEAKKPAEDIQRRLEDLTQQQREAADETTRKRLGVEIAGVRGEKLAAERQAELDVKRIDDQLKVVEKWAKGVGETADASIDAAEQIKRLADAAKEGADALEKQWAAEQEAAGAGAGVAAGGAGAAMRWSDELQMYVPADVGAGGQSARGWARAQRRYAAQERARETGERMWQSEGMGYTEASPQGWQRPGWETDKPAPSPDSWARVMSGEALQAHYDQRRADYAGVGQGPNAVPGSIYPPWNDENQPHWGAMREYAPETARQLADSFREMVKDMAGAVGVTVNFNGPVNDPEAVEKAVVRAVHGASQGHTYPLAGRGSAVRSGVETIRGATTMQRYGPAGGVGWGGM